jgi:hypothetical protein
MILKQKIILWAAISIIGVMLLFPPWTTIDWNHRAAGPYRFVFCAPNERGAMIDKGRLLLPVLVVALVAGALLYTSRNKDD